MIVAHPEFVRRQLRCRNVISVMTASLRDPSLRRDVVRQASTTKRHRCQQVGDNDEDDDENDDINRHSCNVRSALRAGHTTRPAAAASFSIMWLTLRLRKCQSGDHPLAVKWAFLMLYLTLHWLQSVFEFSGVELWITNSLLNPHQIAYRIYYLFFSFVHCSIPIKYLLKRSGVILTLPVPSPLPLTPALFWQFKHLLQCTLYIDVN